MTQIFRFLRRRLYQVFAAEPAGLFVKMASLSPARLFSSPASTSKTSPVRLFSKVKSPKFSKDCKAVIVNVYASIRKLHPEKTVRDVLAIVGEMTGVSPRTVVRFKKEGLSGGVK